MDGISNGDVDTLPHNDRWANGIEGSSRVAKLAGPKAEAQKKGREMAVKRKVEPLIHNKNGTVGQRNSYGPGPRRRRGKRRA